MALLSDILAGSTDRMCCFSPLMAVLDSNVQLSQRMLPSEMDLSRTELVRKQAVLNVVDRFSGQRNFLLNHASGSFGGADRNLCRENMNQKMAKIETHNRTEADQARNKKKKMIGQIASKKNDGPFLFLMLPILSRRLGTF